MGFNLSSFRVSFGKDVSTKQMKLRRGYPCAIHATAKFVACRTGEIPSALGTCSRLKRVNLNNNLLQGGHLVPQIQFLNRYREFCSGGPSPRISKGHSTFQGSEQVHYLFKKPCTEWIPETKELHVSRGYIVIFEQICSILLFRLADDARLYGNLYQLPFPGHCDFPTLLAPVPTPAPRAHIPVSVSILFEFTFAIELGTISHTPCDHRLKQ